MTKITMQQLQEKNDTDLMSRLLPILKDDFSSGSRKSIFPSLSQRIKNGEINDETVLPFISKMSKDIRTLNYVSESGYFAPRRGKKNKEMLQKYILKFYLDNNHKDEKVEQNEETFKVEAIIFYQQKVSLLTKTFIDQEFKEFKRKFGYKADYWTNHTIDSIPAMVLRPFAPEITKPTAMPVEHTPNHELQPIIDYLKANKKPSDGANYDQLNWCTVYPDGRFDSCKQGTGKSILDITEALVNNDKIKHFLYGNNITGKPGCYAIRDLLLNDKSLSKIETWYLAGNDIDSDGIELLAEALIDDHNVKDLWLKRNPLKAEGAKSIKKILMCNTTIETLDLDNTGLMDDGFEEVVKGLGENESLRTLYANANGITNVRSLVSYYNKLINEHLKDPSTVEGVTSLWLGINRLTDSEAIPLIYTLGKYPLMKRLCLGSNMLTEESARACYFAFRNHTGLEVLDLGRYKSTKDLGEISNNIGDRGAHWIAKLIRENRSLLYVDVTDNQLTDIGFYSLSRSLNTSNREYAEFCYKNLVIKYDRRDELYAVTEDESRYIDLFKVLSGTILGKECTDILTNYEKDCMNEGMKEGMKAYQIIHEFGFGETVVGIYIFDSDLGKSNLHVKNEVVNISYVQQPPKLLVLNVGERAYKSQDLDTLMRSRRSGVTDDDIRVIKHGPNIFNIDSIYRNNMKNSSPTSLSTSNEL